MYIYYKCSIINNKLVCWAEHTIIIPEGCDNMALSPNEHKWRDLGDPSACKKCKGFFCCQYNACSSSPDDFNRNSVEMRNALLSGNYSLDLIRSEASFKIKGNFLTLNFEEIKRNPHEAFYIRARNIRKPLVDIIHLKESLGPCVMWNPENGCILPYEHRPKFGRTLVPMPMSKCFDYYDKFGSGMGLYTQIVKEWKPYHEQLVSFVREFADPNPILTPGFLPFRIM